jgi:hypothetical protein
MSLGEIGVTDKREVHRIESAASFRWDGVGIVQDSKAAASGLYSTYRIDVDPSTHELVSSLGWKKIIFRGKVQPDRSVVFTRTVWGQQGNIRFSLEDQDGLVIDNVTPKDGAFRVLNAISYARDSTPAATAKSAVRSPVRETVSEATPGSLNGKPAEQSRPAPAVWGVLSKLAGTRLEINSSQWTRPRFPLGQIQ